MSSCQTEKDSNLRYLKVRTEREFEGKSVEVGVVIDVEAVQALQAAHLWTNQRSVFTMWTNQRSVFTMWTNQRPVLPPRAGRRGSSPRQTGTEADSAALKSRQILDKGVNEISNIRRKKVWLD